MVMFNTTLFVRNVPPRTKIFRTRVSSGKSNDDREKRNNSDEKCYHELYDPNVFLASVETADNLACRTFLFAIVG